MLPWASAVPKLLAVGDSGAWALAVCMQGVGASQRSEITGK